MAAQIIRERLGVAIDPELVFARLFAHEEHAFWLDSGTDATSGRSALGSATSVVTIASGAPDGLGTLGAVLDAVPLGAAGSPDTLDAFPLGRIGWLGYELGARAAGVAVPASPHPDAVLLRVDRAVVLDHATDEWTLVAEGDAPGVAGWLAATGASIRSLAADEGGSNATPTTNGPALVPRWRHTPERYAALIADCREAIARGDAYQLCLTNRVEVDGDVDPLASFLALRRSSPSHHGGYLRSGGVALVSASPEQFLAVTPAGRIRTKPIKGTRPRGATPEADAALRDELLASVKERAENVMIVDLMRNDLSRLAVLGSVRVDALLAVESYPHVHQLVSTVSAQLEPGTTTTDVLRATFPAGSMTGAPKRSAMTILAALEGGPRGVYAGAWGWFGLDGSIDLAMVIRSIVVDERGASIGTGGGITALSDPAEEVEETRLKARALLAALRPASPGARAADRPDETSAKQ